MSKFSVLTVACGTWTQFALTFSGCFRIIPARAWLWRLKWHIVELVATHNFVESFTSHAKRVWILIETSELKLARSIHDLLFCLGHRNIWYTFWGDVFWLHSTVVVAHALGPDRSGSLIKNRRQIIVSSSRFHNFFLIVEWIRPRNTKSRFKIIFRLFLCYVSIYIVCES